MDVRRTAFIILLLASSVSAAKISAYQDSFELMWEAELGGSVLTVKAVDLNGDGEDEVVTNSLYVTSYGKSGTVYALDKDGSERWKYLAGLLEGSYTTDRGYTIVGAGPYAEFLGRGGQVLWKRSTRTSQVQKIYAQSIFAADINGDGGDDALIGTNLGMKGNILSVRDSSGAELTRIPFKSMEFPHTIHTSDMNGDRKHEIIVGTLKYAPNTVSGTYQAAYTRPASLSVYDINGVLKWSDLYDGGVTAATVCDLDQDGLIEVLAGGLNIVTAYTTTGQQLWRADVAGQVNALDCGDVDADGTQEVVAGAGKLYVLKHGGEVLWSYSSGTASAVKVSDLTGDGKPEVLVGSSSVRVIDGEGELLYNSDKYGIISSLDVGDLTGDGWADIVFGSKDGSVRAVNTRRYSMEVAADNQFRLAERAYTMKDYNLTIQHSNNAEELFDLLGKEGDVLKAQGLREKASGYSQGDRYFNMTVQYFMQGMYEKCVESADLALNEYRTLSDLRKLNEVNEVKKQCELLPNAEINFNLSKRFYSEKDYVNASDYALKARSAYSYLGNASLEEQANAIHLISVTYAEFHRQLDMAYNYTLINNYGNATYHLSLAEKEYDKLNDTVLLIQLENISSMAADIKRDESILVYGGMSVVALIVLLTLVTIALLAAFFVQKGGFIALTDFITHYRLWFTEFSLWIKDSIRRRPAMDHRESGGLQGLRRREGESIGEYFKR